jgi:hypothetical protein
MPWKLLFTLALLVGGSGAAYYLTLAFREAVDAWNFDEKRNLFYASLGILVCIHAIVAAAYGLFHLSVKP